jgi:hypothetical protein
MSDNRTFVSYSRADSEFALKLASDLRANGASIWLDQLDIAPGARWDSSIEDALRRSARVIVILSPKAVASQNVLDEVSFALDEGKTIVPVLVETCTVPMRLRRLQYVDFTPGYDAALGRLLGTLGVARKSVSRSAAPPPPPPPEPEPEPPPQEPLRDFATPAPSTAGRQRTMPFAGVAAAIVVLVGVAIWMSSRPDGTADTPTDTVVDTSASTPPAETPAPDNTPAPPPAANPNTGSSAISGLVNSTPALKLPSGADGEPGLKVLLGVTRQFANAETLTEDDLAQLAEAQSKACGGQARTSACAETASAHVESTIKTVCSRKLGLGARPAQEVGAIKYDMQVNGCLQDYMTVLLDRLHRDAQEAIRKIKAG